LVPEQTSVPSMKSLEQLAGADTQVFSPQTFDALQVSVALPDGHVVSAIVCFAPAKQRGLLVAWT
jgi:hypothetical protein